MADEVRLIDANYYRKRRCRTCINRVQCDNGGNLCFDIMVLNTCPTIEAQPDNGWISVDDRLPEAIYDCLVWYCCDTPFGKSKSVDITYCSRGDWYTKHLNGDNIVVLYWMPLPEPPKGE